MINKVFRSEADLHNLSLKRTLSTIKGENLDYKRRVVNKPWGYEYLMFENEYVAIWVLYLKDGFSTSMHCHPNKKTSLTVLSGEVVSSTLDTKFALQKGNALIIDKGVFHSTMGASKEGAFIMEIETPPDKNDLVRLKDNYGRENKAYEGGNCISEDIDQYEYFDFHDCLFEEKNTHIRGIRDVKFTMAQGTFADIISKIDLFRDANYCFLDDRTVKRDTLHFPSVGEVFIREDVYKLQKNNIDDQCLMLIIE